MESTHAHAAVTNPLYDEIMFRPLFLEFYEQSGFGNYGYWKPETSGAREACRNLVQLLMDRMTRKEGKVLDVACGKGETTRCLLDYYPATAITGINISERQLEEARERVPGASFLRMDATELQFPDATFGNVMCVEAAFHFDTRRKFLAEALRVLQPGGTLALTDVLVTLEAEKARIYRTEANYLSGPAAYTELLRELGFRNIRIVDATEECWRGFFRYLAKFLHDRYVTRQISLETLRQHLESNYRMVPDLEYYLLVSAEK